MATLSSGDAAPKTYAHSTSLRTTSKPSHGSSKAANGLSPARTVTTVAASFDFSDSREATFWADLRQRELERADTKIDVPSYKPSYSAGHDQINAAVLEFMRRQVDSDHRGFPAVLVATNAKKIPAHSTRSIEQAGDKGREIGRIKFFLDTTSGSLFIVSLSAKGVHGTGVEFIMRGLMRFDEAFGHFICHDDIIQAVPDGAKAPDAALKLTLPQAIQDGPLRAPFVAEVRSSSYSTDPSSELVAASQYMRTQHADYFLYLFIGKKRADGTFPAAAVLWRLGALSPPLTDGQQATFVSAQSFGTGELEDTTKTCLRNGGGHYPGVPNAVSLDAVLHPNDIVIPKADLLRKVMRADGTLHYQRQGPFYEPGPVFVDGNPVFDFPAAGPDLVISLQRLRAALHERYN